MSGGGDDSVEAGAILDRREESCPSPTSATFACWLLAAAGRGWGSFLRQGRRVDTIGAESSIAAAVGAGGESSPDEVSGEGEDGEDEEEVHFAVRDVAEEDFDEPEDGEHGGE